MKNILFFGLILLFTFTWSSCGDNTDKTEANTEKEKTQTLTKNTEDPSKDPSGIQNSDETGSGKISENTVVENELGMTPGLPKDFPTDVPIPPNSTALGSLSSTEGTVVPFSSKEKVQEIVEFYKSEMEKNGFTMSEAGQNVISEKGGMLGWTKDKREIGIVLAYDKDKDSTSFVITYK